MYRLLKTLIWKRQWLLLAGIILCGPTAVSAAASGAAPDASHGPADVAFYWSGSSGDGVGALTITGAAGLAYVPDRYGVSDGAAYLFAGTHLSIGSSTVAAGLPTGNSARTAAAWIRAQLTPDATEAVVSIGSFTAGAERQPGACTLTTIAGSGSPGFYGDGLDALSASFREHWEIAYDSQGRLLIADAGNHRVRRVGLDGIMTSVAGTGSNYQGGGSGGDGGAAASAQLNYPTNVVVDRSDNIYIAEQIGNRIRRVDAVTGIITTVIGTGVKSSGADGQAGTSTAINAPHGLAVYPDGSLLFAERGGCRIRAWNVTTQRVSSVAGSGSCVYGGDGGLAAAATFNEPYGIFLDIVGNIYVADAESHAVRRIDAVTSIITTVAGTATQGFAGEGGAAIAAQLWRPRTISADHHGNIYIVEDGCRIVRVDAMTKKLTRLLGTANSGYAAGFTPDGTFTTSSAVYAPFGLLFRPDGSAVFNDHGNLRIRRISASCFSDLRDGSWSLLSQGSAYTAGVAARGGSAGFGVAGPAVVDSKWRHIAATFDGTSQRLYVDGVQVAEAPATFATTASSNSALVIGDAVPGAPSAAYSGSIGDLRIYNRALSPNEIAELALPVLPVYPNAVNPVPTAGATSYTWECSPGYSGFSMTWTLDPQYNSWSSSGGPVNCVACPTDGSPCVPPSPSPSSSPTGSPSVSATRSPSSSPSATSSPSESRTPSPSTSPSWSVTSSPSCSPSSTATWIPPSATPSTTQTVNFTASPSGTANASGTPSPSMTPSVSSSPSVNTSITSIWRSQVAYDVTLRCTSTATAGTGTCPTVTTLFADPAVGVLLRRAFADTHRDSMVAARVYVPTADDVVITAITDWPDGTQRRVIGVSDPVNAVSATPSPPPPPSPSPPGVGARRLTDAGVTVSVALSVYATDFVAAIAASQAIADFVLSSSAYTSVVAALSPRFSLADAVPLSYTVMITAPSIVKSSSGSGSGSGSESATADSSQVPLIAGAAAAGAVVLALLAVVGVLRSRRQRQRQQAAMKESRLTVRTVTDKRIAADANAQLAIHAQVAPGLAGSHRGPGPGPGPLPGSGPASRTDTHSPTAATTPGALSSSFQIDLPGSGALDQLAVPAAAAAAAAAVARPLADAAASAVAGAAELLEAAAPAVPLIGVALGALAVVARQLQHMRSNNVVAAAVAERVTRLEGLVTQAAKDDSFAVQYAAVLQSLIHTLEGAQRTLEEMSQRGSVAAFVSARGDAVVLTTLQTALSNHVTELSAALQLETLSAVREIHETVVKAAAPAAPAAMPPFSMQLTQRDFIFDPPLDQQMLTAPRGSYGVVVFGYWKAANLPVAVKLLPARGPHGEQLISIMDWLAEAELMRRLRDSRAENVVLLLGIGAIEEASGVARFIVAMERMDGGALRTLLDSYLRAGRQPALEVAVGWCLDIARGIAECHAAMVVHSDVKAANVLLTATRKAKLGDLGTARVTRSINATMTRGGTATAVGARGTLLWLAPELIEDSTAAPSLPSDVYSWAVTAWEVLTLHLPYHDAGGTLVVNLDRLQAMIDLVAGKLRPDMALVRPDAPAALLTLIQAAWHSDPRSRPKMSEVVQQLQALLTDEAAMHAGAPAQPGVLALENGTSV